MNPVFGIVGLGVMGGSFAKRLSELEYTVYAVDINEEALNLAKENNWIVDGSSDPSKILPKCDVLIFCLYPTKIAPFIEEHASSIKPNTLIWEISGVKESVLKDIMAVVPEGAELLSIHPMCGRESRGLQFADGAIFDHANFLIVPDTHNTDAAIDFTKHLAHELGCVNVSLISPEEHDRMIGFLSQLTHVIAVALMNTHENSHLVKYTGDSFRDLTRIAKINEDMWSELFILNKEILLDEIDQFIDAMENFRNLIDTENTNGMKNLFVESTKRRKLFDKK